MRGVQGQHKIARGYLPTATYSSHFITHPEAAFHIRRHLQSSARETELTIEMLTREATPFKGGDKQEDLDSMLRRLMSRAADQAT